MIWRSRWASIVGCVLRILWLRLLEEVYNEQAIVLARLLGDIDGDDGDE